LQEGQDNWYTKYLLHWKAKPDSFDDDQQLIKKKVNRAAIRDVLGKERKQKPQHLH